jgi:hypothetical protein
MTGLNHGQFIVMWEGTLEQEETNEWQFFA